MTPYYRESLAPQTITLFDSQGQISYEATSLINGGTYVLENVGSTLSGNFKSPLPWSFTKTERRTLSGVTYSIRKSSNLLEVQISGNSGYLCEVPGSQPDAHLYNECLSRINDQIRNGVDWGTTLAQANQVSSMVRSAYRTLLYVKSFDMRKLADAYDTYQQMKRRRSRTKTAAKSIADHWLAYQYGLKPLIQDCYNTAVELGRDFPSLMIAEAKASEVKSSSSTSSFPGGNDLVTDTQTSARCLIKIRYLPNSSTTSLLSNFTTLNPAAIAYELMPWSFAFDWFYNVGGYMRNLETSLLSQSVFRDGFITTTCRNHSHSTVNGSYDNGDTIRVDHLGGSGSYSSLFRTPLSTMPFPRAPVFRADLGVGRLMNAAALIAQAMTR